LNDLSVAQWREIKVAYGHRCVYCGRKMQHLTQDHITPLSKGGSHTAPNVVPACLSCNSKKRARAPLVPVQPLLLTIAPCAPIKGRKRA
jgi:5-methylcytosine-specific restriction endonuclease McrA